MAGTERTPRDTPDDDNTDGSIDGNVKDDVVEYFGADGEDEGKKFHETGELSDIDDQTIAPG